MKKKKNKIVLSYKKKVELSAEIYGMMMEGDSDGEIIESLDITPQEYSIAKKFLLESKGSEEELLSSKERFAKYVIVQDRNTRALDELIVNLDHKNQYNALVGAIRLRSDIADRVISTGQTLGIISKEPEKKMVMNGVVVAEVSDKDLRKELAKSIVSFGKMMKRYGGGKDILEIKTGDLHYGEGVKVLPEDFTSTAAMGAPPMKPKSNDKKNRAKTGKRAAGRRRVREK
jgi:hypothetical protein